MYIAVAIGVLVLKQSHSTQLIKKINNLNQVAQLNKYRTTAFKTFL
jgi:hypothetical protein